MAVPALENANESIIDRLKAEGQLTRNRGTNSLKVVISKLDGIFNLLKDQSVFAAQAEATAKFKQDEEEAESARKEKAGKIAERVQTVGNKVTSVLGKLLSFLAVPALLAFLTFLPEILESETFKKLLKAIGPGGRIRVLVEGFYENTILPIVNFFVEGFKNLIDDISNPDKTLGDIFTENLALISVGFATLFRKQLITIVGKVLGFVATSLGPKGVILLAIAALLAISAKNIKEEFDKEGDFVKAIVKGVARTIGQIIDFIPSLFGVETNFEKDLGNAVGNLYDSIGELIKGLITNIKLGIGKVATTLGMDESTAEELLGLESGALSDKQTLERKRLSLQEGIGNIDKQLERFEEKASRNAERNLPANNPMVKTTLDQIERLQRMRESRQQQIIQINNQLSNVGNDNSSASASVSRSSGPIVTDSRKSVDNSLN